MVRVQVVETIAVPPEKILEFVMDIERYAEVDAKIKPILWARREGNRLEFACRPKLAGLPQPKVIQFAELTPGRRIDIGLLPLPNNRIAHALANFEANFDCIADGDVTRVTRTLEFTFVPAVRWFMEPLFRRRLPAEVRDEVRRAKDYLERGTH
jgi:hypothetical protein